MGKGRTQRPGVAAAAAAHAHRGRAEPTAVVATSLLDQMVDGREYESVVAAVLPTGFNLINEAQRALREIEAVRGRPCLLYVGNVANGTADAAVIPKDDLPFMEMVQSVPANQRSVDVFLATNGGSGAQIARFVNALRSRFDQVDFLIPSYCMSAGTLFALSGDQIWMTPQACLGPIDPQSPTQSGRYVPAQALLLLVQKLQEDGQKALAAGQPVPWTAVRIIDTMDKKDLGDAITASDYSINLATEFLINYKFRNWNIRQSSGHAVTEDYRKQRASDVAKGLASHERWKSHGHSISREVLWDQIKLQISHPPADVERAIRRAWAVCYWIFDKTATQKMILGANYSYITFTAVQPMPGK